MLAGGVRDRTQAHKTQCTAPSPCWLGQLLAVGSNTSHSHNDTDAHSPQPELYRARHPRHSRNKIATTLATATTRPMHTRYDHETEDTHHDHETEAHSPQPQRGRVIFATATPIRYGSHLPQKKRDRTTTYNLRQQNITKNPQLDLLAVGQTEQKLFVKQKL